ncbi:MAG: C10 family peptidase [Bacteroidota bacterium]|nr:C10 family peptidase [Bacteroidota bacterium]
MKKLFIILMIIALSVNLLAEKVDVDKAKVIAKDYYSFQLNNITGEALSDPELKETFTIKNLNDTLFYVFNFESGFTIVSAEDLVPPILGFSVEGLFSVENQPPGLADLFEHYKNQIIWARSNLTEQSEEVYEKWQSLHNLKNRSYGTCEIWPKTYAVNPILTTTWNQACYYNDKCPYDTKAPLGYCNHVPNGCVALAMAQVMKKWNYPAQGTGSHGYWDGAGNPDAYGYQFANFGTTTYDWDEMPDYLTGNQHPPDRSTSNQIDAVSTLIYHCGVSVDMDYGYYGSGAQTAATRDALVNFFNYSPAAVFRIKADHSNSEWELILRNNLKLKEPIIYRGTGSQGGHAFVLDGFTKYQTLQCTYSALFHINWGWGGNDNGYFYLTDLTPGGMNFNSNQAAVVNIEALNVTYNPPPQPGSIYSACSPHCRDWEVEYEINPIEEATSYEWEIIGNRAGITWTDTYAKVWSHYTGQYNLRVRALNHGIPGPWREQNIEITECGRESSPKLTHFNNHANIQYDISISPNPINDNLFVQFPESLVGEKKYITLTDINGKSLYQYHTLENTVRVPVDYLINGIYILLIVTEEDVFSEKILILK